MRAGDLDAVLARARRRIESELAIDMRAGALLGANLVLEEMERTMLEEAERRIDFYLREKANLGGVE